MTDDAVDLVVRTGNPRLLDATMSQLPGTHARVVDGSWSPEESTCRLRVSGDAGFARFALSNQGYGDVVGEASPSDPVTGIDLPD